MFGHFFFYYYREEEPEDVYHISHEEDVVKKVTYRVKLLQFHTNYRPPYYGTWRKKSSVLTPKFPWKQDTVSLLSFFTVLLLLTDFIIFL